MYLHDISLLSQDNPSLEFWIPVLMIFLSTRSTVGRHAFLKQLRLSCLQELSYDYGYQKNSVMKPDGSIKKATCHCGAVNCTGRLY